MEISRKELLRLASSGVLASTLAGCATTDAQDALDAAMSVPEGSTTRNGVAAFHRDHFSADQLKILTQFGANLVYGERRGAQIQDRFTGRWYWDCHRMGSTYNIGHRHPAVLETLRKGLERLDLGNFLLMSDYRQLAAEKLLATVDDSLSGVVFTVSGAEANETAFKAARLFTEKTKTIYFEGAYHGDTLMTLAAAGDERRKALYGAENFDCVGIPFNDVEAAKAAIDDQTCALIAEPTVAQTGFPVPDEGFWPTVASHCRSVGAVLILDEVQTGGSATGPFWHHQSLGFTPDILVSGKWPSGGLFPNSFALVRSDIHEAYTAGVFMPHPSSFAGSDLGCLVTSAVIDVLAAPELRARVERLSAFFGEAFADLPITVNQNGLCIGLIDARRPAWRNVLALLEEGVLTVPAYHNNWAVEFRPMLTLADQEAEEIAHAVQRVFA